MIRIARILGMMAWFAWELILANFRMARDVLLPLGRLKPVILAIPLEPGDERLLALFSNGITLTPGTLSLDVSEDGRYLFIHAMNVSDVERFRRELKHGFLGRIRRAVS